MRSIKNTTLSIGQSRQSSSIGNRESSLITSLIFIISRNLQFTIINHWWWWWLKEADETAIDEKYSGFQFALSCFFQEIFAMEMLLMQLSGHNEVRVWLTVGEGFINFGLCFNYWKDFAVWECTLLSCPSVLFSYADCGKFVI